MDYEIRINSVSDARAAVAAKDEIVAAMVADNAGQLHVRIAEEVLPDVLSILLNEFPCKGHLTKSRWTLPDRKFFQLPHWDNPSKPEPVAPLPPVVESPPLRVVRRPGRPRKVVPNAVSVASSG